MEMESRRFVRRGGQMGATCMLCNVVMGAASQCGTETNNSLAGTVGPTSVFSASPTEKTEVELRSSAFGGNGVETCIVLVHYRSEWVWVYYVQPPPQRKGLLSSCQGRAVLIKSASGKVDTTTHAGTF